MQNILINKYLSKKQKSLYSYAEVLYKLYPIDKDSLWKSDGEFELILNSTIKTYLNKYYLKDIDEKNSLNIKNYSQDNFKLAYALAIVADTYKDSYEELKNNHKKGLYDLTIMVYIITNIDIDINFKTKIVSTSEIIDNLQKYFKVIDQVKIIDKNPFIIDILANKIKDNIRLERKFFNSLKSNESYNMFTKYDNKSYFVKHFFENESLDKYQEIDVERVFKKYLIDEEYYKICFDLVSVTILKEYILNSHVHSLILPITSNYIKNEKNIAIINDIFDNFSIKAKIKFSINYSDYKKNRDVFSVLKNNGFGLVLYMDRDEMILDYANIKLDLSIYAKDKFIKNNPKFINFVETENIEYQIVNKNVYINEDELLEKCKEE